MSDSSSSSSDLDDSVPPPPAAECQRRIDLFLSLSARGADEAYAQMMLQRNQWDVDKADRAHIEREARRRGLDLTTRAPERITAVTWNIDGLDEANRAARTDFVCQEIKRKRIEIVFLQEVVEETLSSLKASLSGEYHVLAQDNGDPRGDYFTAVLLRRLRVYLDSFETAAFEGSRMGRGVQVVECRVGQAKLTLINTHLESTKDHSSERQCQLQECFSRALSAAEDRSVLFGGDLNLRDSDLSALGLDGGPPVGLDDLWVEGGSRKECRYTWDMTRNTNLEFPGRFKPRCRFDRLYLRDSQPKRVKLLHFGLVGLEKVPGTQRFPSDHWGIEVALKLKSND